MPTVRGAATAVARSVGLLVLCAVVVGCAVWGADRWGEAARQQARAEEYAQAHASPGPVTGLPDFPTGPHDLVPYLPGRDSQGEISVRVRRAGPDEGWRIVTRYRLSLSTKDPLVSALRASPEEFAAVAYVLPGGEASAEPVGFLEPEIGKDRGDLAGLPDWCTVSQPTSKGRVTVTAEHNVTTGSAQGTALATYALSKRVGDGDEGVVPRLPGRWTWSMDVPKEWGFRVEGRPDRQTAHSIRFRLTHERGTAEVTPVLVAGDESTPVKAAAARPYTASGYQALLTLFFLCLAFGGALIGLLRTPGTAVGVRRRARSVALGTGVLLCAALAALLEDLYLPRWSVLGWLWGGAVFRFSDLTGEPLPMEAHVQGAFLGLALFALPVLLTGFARRSRTASWDSTGPVLAVASPALALLLLAWAMGGGDWTGTVLSCLACASLAAGAVLGALLLPHGTRESRTWAVPCAVTTWAAVTSTIVLQALPRNMAQQPSGLSFTYTRLTLLASWPTVLVLLAPWVAALAVLTGPRLSGPRRLLLGVVLIPAQLPYWNPLRDWVSPELPPTAALLIQLTGQSPGETLILGVRMMAPALQTIWLIVTALLLVRLHDTGARPGTWGPTARGHCVTLLVLAASATVIGSPESWLPYWSTGAALLTAWAGALLLLPARHADRAAALHALSGAAHSRRMAALARALLFAEGRHRFLTSSRAALADASQPADTWDEKWRGLKRPTAADAARETERLRATALGGSAGRPAWANAVAATAASALLTLPWTTWTLWQSEGYGGIPEAITLGGGATCVWLAHGFAYGYLYPWLRGNSPVAKAGWLWSVMSTVQILLVVPRLQVPSGATTLSVFLLLAQSTVMALGLALYWEIRLVRRADLLWGHIRNFRRLSSLATPVSAVLVAAIAAAVTVLATAWANDVTAPVDTPSPSPTSSASSSATP
ncbi:hypothetical protein [Streptomyces sp. NPDC052114]|uniref:hypothetical protein n=1 Tax=unclassified Streptomyces TaxID=2593676 RepID=UPI003413AA73